MGFKGAVRRVESIRVLSRLLCFGCLFAAVPALALPPARDFDPTKGVIDGKTACALWPITSEVNPQPGEPAGFDAHIALKDDPDSEVVHPAGKWFMPGSYGIFMVWLENPGQFLISPSPTPLHYHGSPFNGEGMALVGRIVPAGRIKLAQAVCSGGCSLGLIHENSQVLPDGGVRPEMRKSADERIVVERGVLMPAGPVAVTLFDKRAKAYRAIEVPVNVTARQTVVVHPKPPAPGQSDLIVVLTRPELLHKAGSEDVAPRLVLASGKTAAPVFTVSGPRLFYSIWKGVSAGKATLSVQTKTARLPPVEIVLRSGHVESFDASLTPLPHLGVRLDLPADLRREPLKVAVSGAKEPLGEVARQVPADSERVDFDHVPAGALRVTVVAGPWQLEEVADLSDGKDGEVTVAAQRMAIEGTVYYGGAPRQGELSFMTNHKDDRVTVTTDAEGRYRISLERPMTYIVTVRFPDRGRPFVLPLNIVHGGRQDLRVPANDLRVRVVTSDTGAPVVGAQVALLNAGADQITDGQSIETGKDGIAHAQPLRPGTIEVSAKARHFAPGESITEKVPEDDFSREITLVLKPLEGESPVAFLLASGQPALGAEVWVQPDATGPPLILGADEAGNVSLPDLAAARPILVRAPGAASGFVVWDGESDSIRLGPAGPPLTFSARKENGDPGAWARFELWVDGVAWTGPQLQWAFSAQPSGDANGSVTLRGLPPKPVEVLFWSPEGQTAKLAQSGALDARRTEVAFPWPAVVTATLVE